MSKQLDEAAMLSELSGSAFFAGNGQREGKPSSKLDGEPATTTPATPPRGRDAMTPRHHDTTMPSQQSSHQVIETIRSAVRQQGKEVATGRLTVAEKKALGNIVYTYGSSGVRTTQNEITRIAINWLVEDYRANGARSVLDRVLERLNE